MGLKRAFISSLDEEQRNLHIIKPVVLAILIYYPFVICLVGQL